MKKWFLLLSILTLQANAESTYITMPGEGWTLKLETPAITSLKGEVSERLIRYMASSVETGITLSVNSETEAVKSNKECFDTFWKKAQDNPMMVKSSINTSSDKTAYYATHYSEGEYRGQSFKSANGHAYFVKNGLCIDLHVSHWPFAKHSEEKVKKILKSIEIVQP